MAISSALDLVSSFQMIQTKANEVFNRLKASDSDYIIFPQRGLNLKMIHDALHLNNY